MTRDKIKMAALHYFANKGYEATSLQLIAEEVGIKKQSIYAFFKNKDQLFLEVFAEAVHKEIAELDNYFKRYALISLDRTLHDLMLNFKDRYDQEMNLRLIMYVGFLIPASLLDEINEKLDLFVNYKQQCILQKITENTMLLRMSPQAATTAYMNMIEGMLVELIYRGTARYEERLEPTWNNFWHGLIHTVKQQ